jgi:hypothetical protein
MIQPLSPKGANGTTKESQWFVAIGKYQAKSAPNPTESVGFVMSLSFFRRMMPGRLILSALSPNCHDLY